MTTPQDDSPGDEQEIMMLSVMKATGLPREAVEELMGDNELDELCDAVLSDLALPSKQAGSTEA